ncbi:MAG: SRPBCC domain-containing protein [Terracidiphilus sp.]
MIVNATAGIEDLTLLVEQEIHVHASLEDTFAALLEQLGPENEVGEGRVMPMVLEAWPGGRWYRDLGDDNGHFWAHVQAIKRPTLLEFSGPLMMSHPVANNVQYRLSEEPGGTLIKFRHSGFGMVQEDHRKGVVGGWGYIHGKVRERAEGSHKK